MSEFEQPAMNCPQCQKEYPDFDGVGVVYCAPPGGCGFCRHVSRSGQADGSMKCDLCGHVQPTLDLAEGITIYRAACMEEVDLEPGRIVACKVLRIEKKRNLAWIQRIWHDGATTEPQCRTASQLISWGWRDTPELAAMEGIVYLRRHAADCRISLARAERALAALLPKVGS